MKSSALIKNQDHDPDELDELERNLSPGRLGSASIAVAVETDMMLKSQHQCIPSDEPVREYTLM